MRINTNFRALKDNDHCRLSCSTTQLTSGGEVSLPSRSVHYGVSQNNKHVASKRDFSVFDLKLYSSNNNSTSSNCLYGNVAQTYQVISPERDLRPTLCFNVADRSIPSPETSRSVCSPTASSFLFRRREELYLLSLDRASPTPMFSLWLCLHSADILPTQHPPWAEVYSSVFGRKQTSCNCRRRDFTGFTHLLQTLWKTSGSEYF